MKNWKILESTQYLLVWKFVYDKLLFCPYEKEKIIKLPKPNKCFDISKFYDENFKEESYEELHESVLIWFKQIAYGEKMYALNWQHECYTFYPNLYFEKNEFNEWLVPVFPNGDYLFFLTMDFKNGIFADGINFKICFWGNKMINAFDADADKPSILIKQIY